ncbi:uncharacterized protein LOC144446392 [Glandiceps talaboti]
MDVTKRQSMIELTLQCLVLLLVNSVLSHGQSHICSVGTTCTCEEHETEPSQFQNIFCSSSILVNTVDPVVIPTTLGLQIECDPRYKIDSLDVIVSQLQNKDVLVNLSLLRCPVSQLLAKNPVDIPSLQKLRIHNSEPFEISQDVFQDLPNLRVIDFQSNGLTAIPNSITCTSLQQPCRPLQQLEELYLQGNTINWIPNDTFSNVPNLKKLNLTNNSLHSLPGELFSPLEHLQELDLSFNMIDTLPLELFQNLTELEVLHLSSNKLTEMHPIHFRGMTDLKILDNSYNQLMDLPNDLFREVQMTLQHLNLKHNFFHRLPNDLFLGLNAIRSIDLSQNNFTWTTSSSIVLFKYLPFLRIVNLQSTNIHSGFNVVFEGCPSVSSIDISDNHIQIIPRDFINRIGAPSMETLNFARNDISVLYSYAFQNSNSLRDLILSHNRLQNIPKRAFSQLPGLQKLDLSYNAITFMHIQALFQLPNLIELHLNNNRLINFQVFLYARQGALLKPQSLAPDYLHVDSPISVYMEENPFSCDCDMFSSLFNKTGHAMYEDIVWPGRQELINQKFMPDPDNLICASPPNVQGKAIKRLRKNSFWCEMPQLCSQNCTCSAIAIELRLVANCSNRGLTEIPTDLWWGTSYLYLDGNNITQISSNHLSNLSRVLELYLNNNSISSIADDAFKDLTSIRIVDLSSNNIPEITTHTFGTMSELKALSLDSNQISYIDVYSFHNLTSLVYLTLNNNLLSYVDLDMFNFTKSLRYVRLDNNPYVCDCDLWWVDFKSWMFEPKVIPLLAGSRYNTTCQIQHETNKSTIWPIMQLTESDLECHGNHTDYVKHILLTNNQTWILAFTLGVFVFIVLIAIIVYRFNKILKVIIYNRTGWRFLAKENFDQDKVYDAFLSFSSDDLGWVKNSLLKNLENHDPPYKVCIHHRDFLVGACIAENIVDAIEKSKRTILVLSDNFLKSEWCAYEFQKAHHQVIKDKSSRLIVILMEEIAQNRLDKDLKMYLKTNTYLEKTDPLFWEKLYSAMPNIGNRQFMYDKANKAKCLYLQHGLAEKQVYIE